MHFSANYVKKLCVAQILESGKNVLEIDLTSWRAKWWLFRSEMRCWLTYRKGSESLGDEIACFLLLVPFNSKN